MFVNKKANPKTTVPKQGDVIWVDMDEEDTLGHEEQKKRPVLVISNDRYNRICNGLVKVVPITTTDNEFPYHVDIPDGAKVHGKLMLQQERVIDAIARDYEYSCHLSDGFVKKIIEMLLTSY